MDYCLYRVTFDNLCQHRRVARVALIEGNVRGKQPAISSREIIENHHRTADGATGQHCMAADIACTSRNDYCTACHRSEEHTSELQSLMRISYAVFCLKK